MNKILIAMLWLLALASVAGLGAAQEPVALRFLCFQERNECEIYADLLTRFSESNPDIRVTVEAVAEAEIHERLSAPGHGLDFARIADQSVMQSRDYGLRHGFADTAAVVAPFVNTSLFAQAGVALPGAEATWDDWLLALRQVSAATDTPYMLAVDNKDHRLVGPAMSLGARYFDEDGFLTLPDADGLRDFLEILQGLMQTGKTPADTLLGTGSSEAYFVRGETVMYICGSWKAEDVAAQAGDDFEWTIAPNPTGTGGGTGVAQFTALATFVDAEHPDAVAQVFEYLYAPDIAAEFAARTLTVPAQMNADAATIDYHTDDEVVAAALNAFAREVPKLQDQAIALDLHPLAPVYYEASNAFLRQYFAGELTLDEALAGLRERLEQAANSAEAD